MKKERSARRQSEEVLRQGFNDGLEKMRDRYDKAERAEHDAQKMSSDHLKASAQDRIDGQVHRLEQENLDLKDARVAEELKMKNRKDREVKNVASSYQKNVDELSDRLKETLDQSNERNHRNIDQVRKEASEQAVERSRYYRRQMDHENRINRQAYSALKDDLTSRNEQAQALADARVRHVVDDTEETKARLVELQKDNLIESQRAKQDQIKQVRDAMTDEKNQALNRMQEQIRKQEAQHLEKMTSVVAKYEKQVQSLKDQLVKERKSNEENLKRTVDEMRRANKVALDQADAQNRDRMRQVNLQHTEELRTMSRRNEEKLDQLVGQVKKT